MVDRLTLQHDPNQADDAATTLAVVDAMPHGSNCDQGNDMVFEVAGTASVQNLTTGCPNKLAVFSPGRGVLFECTKAAGTDTPPQTKAAATGTPSEYDGASTCHSDLENIWTSGADEVKRDPLPAELDVKLVAWHRVGDAPVEAVLKVDVGYANSVYRARRAGLRIDGRTVGSSGSVKNYSPDDYACTEIERVLEFDAQADAVNVVYVQEISLGGDASVRGLMCDRSPELPPIIVISFTRKAPATLAHEVAHVMSLSSRVFPDFPYGHITNLEGFDDSNLMSQYERPNNDRDYLTLGQVFRMVVDQRSWVNQSAGGIRSGDREPCQAKRFSSTPCPRLDLDAGAQP